MIRKLFVILVLLASFAIHANARTFSSTQRVYNEQNGNEFVEFDPDGAYTWWRNGKIFEKGTYSINEQCSIIHWKTEFEADYHSDAEIRSCSDLLTMTWRGANMNASLNGANMNTSPNSGGNNPETKPVNTNTSQNTVENKDVTPRSETAGNVVPFISDRRKDKVWYGLTNKNDYKVTVTVWAIYKNEVVSNEQIHVIEANRTISGESIYHWAGDKSDFNPNYLSIRISVAK